MGLKDRLREAAQQAQEGLAKGAQQAQEGLARGQAKLEQFQNRPPAAEELLTLGQAYWVQQSGRATGLQLEAVLEAVRPAILESEGRNGPTPWPPMPGAGPTGPAPWAAPPPVAPSWSSPPEPAVSGPVGAGPAGDDGPEGDAGPAGEAGPAAEAAPAAEPRPSSIPTAIHHDPVD